MAARLALLALLAGIGAYAQSQGEAAYDDTVQLVQQEMRPFKLRNEEWLGTKSDDSVSEKEVAQHFDELYAQRSTGLFCLTSTDIMGKVGCKGGKDCVMCVNGIFTCKQGFQPVIDYAGKMNCATQEARDGCLAKGCVRGGCCEQKCCPPEVTEKKPQLFKLPGMPAKPRSSKK